MADISPKAEINLVTLEARVKAALSHLDHALDYSWIRSVNAAIRELSSAIPCVESLRFELIKHSPAGHRIEFLKTSVVEQERWMLECGGTLEGYVERYGTPGTDFCHGDGGETIYYADMTELMNRRRQLAFVQSRAARF